MNKIAKLSDLKTGMRVKIRNGVEYVVVLNVFDPRKNILITVKEVKNNNSFMFFNLFNDDMTSKITESLDIVEVFLQKSFCNTVNIDLKDCDRIKIYER